MKRTRITLSGTLVSAALWVFCAAPFLAAQEPAEEAGLEAQLARAAELYAPAEWPQSARRAGLALGEIDIQGYRGEPLRAAGETIERRYAGAEEELPPFTVEAVVCDTAKDAQRLLLTWLATLASVDPAPRALDLGAPVGDAGYVGLSAAGEGAMSWIAFARANVAVRILADDPRQTPRPDLTLVARTLDEKIAEEPPLAEDAPLPRPAIQSFAAERFECRAGEVLRLDLAVEDPAGGPYHVEWIVGGPGQGYVERREDGAWRLYTTGSGAIRLVAEVTGRFGTMTSRAIDLQVGAER
ncbi:MAG: hypothetical protein HY812_06865 [Planctomycetes bacterium]|nr:hypothetical protein [Planctomycetota bacterium]